MNRINFDEHCDERLDDLKTFGYPDCTKIPMEIDDFHGFRIGTACYVISKAYPAPRLMMFLGCYAKNGKFEDEFRFCCDKGEYYYKAKNLRKTYNVFRTM